MNVRTRLFLITVILLSTPCVAWSLGTPAGTQITSQAQVTFTSGSGPHAAQSNPVATLVAEVLDLIDTRILAEIIEACIDADPGAALTACRRASDSGIDSRRLGAALASGFVLFPVRPRPAGGYLACRDRSAAG